MRSDMNQPEEELHAHLAELDKQPLPAVHAQVDIWEDRARRRHYMAVLTVEANHETKGLDVYC